MDEMVIRPRFSETDALGHISNTTMPVWFETAREAVFSRVHPTMTFDNWPLIIAGYDIALKQQAYLGHNVTIRTGVESIGNSSIRVYQEAWQNDHLVATGRTTMVYFDYQSQRPQPVPADVRERLTDLMVNPGQ